MLLTELDLCVNHSTRSMNEVIVMHKKDALGVELSPLNAMEKPHYTNSDFGVCDVNGHSYGKHEITELHVISTGSGCGLPRVSPSDYQRHRGLTREHKIGYIQWYRYFKNGAN
jgi:hypothetical protein